MSIGLLGGIIFVVVFAGIILVHELGHFFIARLMKIEVEEFGFGFPHAYYDYGAAGDRCSLARTAFVIPINFDLTFDPNNPFIDEANVVAF